MKRDVIVTCEHASNEVPDAYKSLFVGQSQVLSSHRGYDPHAIEMATVVASQLNCDLIQGTVSRLLVELNRSLSHRQLFSEFSRSLDATARQELLDAYYLPYRSRVEQAIRSHVRRRRAVLHLSMHTFTPVLGGKPRIADVGLLFDPSRQQEASLMHAWRQALWQRLPTLRTRRNYPYYGRCDGLTTALRTKFADASYLGIEIEVCNTLRPASALWQQLAQTLSSLASDFMLASSK